MPITNTFTKGMNTDIHPIYQEDGTYRFALNALLETTFGDTPSISNEGGNTSCSINFPSSKKIIGSAVTENEDFILFLYDPEGQHEIGRFSPVNCTYTSLLVAECLNFSDKHPINVLYRIRNGCEPHVYFTDDYNPYRVLNLNDLEQYKIDGAYFCPKMDFSRDYFHPCLSLYQGVANTGILENAGGKLDIGVYYFAVRFLDKYQNPTKWTIYSRPVAIGDEPYSYTQDNSTVTSYDGGSNDPNSEYYVNKTNKAISLIVNGEADLFDYYQVAIIKRTTDAGDISGVDITHPLPWTGASTPFIYKGTEDQILNSISLEELLAENVKIRKVVAQASENNRLYLANTKGNYRDYTKFQQYASKIKTEWVKTQVSDDKSSRVRQGIYYFQEGSLMEDEVYPFGIVYVFEDGSESPVFYTIGRPADTGIPVNGFNPYIGSLGVATDLQPWDTGTATYGDTIGSTRRWAQISTAVQYGNTQVGLMGYHESDNKTYPDIATCEPLPDGYWGRDWQGNVIVPGVTKIRHHRMPGAELKGATVAASNFRTGVRFSNVEYPPDQGIVGHYFVYGDRTFERKILAKGAFIPLEVVGTEHIIDPSTIAAKNYTTPAPPNTGINAHTYAFISSDLLLKEQIYKGAYVKFEKIYRDLNQEADDASITQIATGIYTFDEDNKYVGGLDIATQFRYFSLYTTPAIDNLIHTFRTDLFLPKSYPGSQDGEQSYEPLSNVTFINNSINTPYHIIRLNSGKNDIETAGGQ